MIAAARNESLSWMLEKALIEHFGERPPDYVEPEPLTPAQRQDDAERAARARHKQADVERTH